MNIISTPNPVCKVAYGSHHVTVLSEMDDICFLSPVDVNKPKCTGFIRRWTFDSNTGKCRRYVYGGCHGTQNLFRTRTQCKKRCDPGETLTRTLFWPCVHF